MRFTLFILICCIIASLCSCSKQTDYSYLDTDRRNCAKEVIGYSYKFYMDKRPKDTTVFYHDYSICGKDLQAIIDQNKYFEDREMFRVCANNLLERISYTIKYL